jgi:threonylcarbamoyladenosine tRNA methylthiotransferase MtaB
MTATLLAAGGTEVKREQARLVIINTCTVTGEAEMKTRKAIRQALAGTEKPWVIATGCAITVNQSSFETLGERVIAQPNRIEATNKALKLLGLERGTQEAPPRSGENFNRRMGVKIQDGCNNRCSYCIVPTARGSARSTSVEEIIEQIVQAEQDGVREVVLTGVNIGCYQSDHMALGGLAKTLLERTEAVRIRLSSLEPQHTTDELLDIMAGSQGRLCAHLHLPLQSGCDTTLRAMGRHYTAAFFEDRVVQARARMPHLSLTTDVIVGFPGETDEDFDVSFAFCKRMGFSRIHVFRYSKRPGTPAALHTDHITPPVTAKRAARLRELSEQLQQSDLLTRINTTERVLVERPGRGMSESYHRVQLPTNYAVGSLIPLQFTGCRDTLLLAERIEVL